MVTPIDVSGRPDIFWTHQYSSKLLAGITAPDGHAFRTYRYTGGLLTAALDPLGNTIESQIRRGRARDHLEPGDVSTIVSI